MRVLGEDNVTHVCVDDYHRYDRRQRAERNITPLHPDCNYMDIMAQHLAHLRAGEPFLKPVYQHNDGTFGPLVRVEPKQFAVVEGLLGYYTEELRSLFDVRIYLAPPEELRRKWKVQRDCSRRGYTTDQVLVRARPARARLGGVHPAAAAATPTSSSRSCRTAAATRSTSTPSCPAPVAPASRLPLACSTARSTRATGSGISEHDGEMHLLHPRPARPASGAERSRR